MKNKKLHGFVYNDKFIDIIASQGIKPEDLADELKGKPVHIPQVNFDVPLEQKVRASLGMPSYAVRAKMMEDKVDELIEDLSEQWVNLADQMRGDPERFKKVWTAIVETVELDDLNKLIKEHNTFYPIEANLKEDPETRQIMIGSTPWRPTKKISHQSLLDKYPPSLDQALKELDSE